MLMRMFYYLSKHYSKNDYLINKIIKTAKINKYYVKNI